MEGLKISGDPEEDANVVHAEEEIVPPDFSSVVREIFGSRKTNYRGDGRSSLDNNWPTLWRVLGCRVHSVVISM